MDYRLLEARHVAGFVMWLRLSDRVEGELDLREELHGPVLEPLRDIAVLSAFAIHPELHTLVWPNGAHLAPEFLHDSIRVTA